MHSDEFSLIDKYFSGIGPRKSETRLGVGDDAAVCTVPEGQQIVSSMDTLIEGVHFLPGTSAADIAYKALAVNVSDLAAMAADPAWFMLSLSLPQMDDDWLTGFSEALGTAAEGYRIELIGGENSVAPSCWATTDVGDKRLPESGCMAQYPRSMM